MTRPRLALLTAFLWSVLAVWSFTPAHVDSPGLSFVDSTFVCVPDGTPEWDCTAAEVG